MSEMCKGKLVRTRSRERTSVDSTGALARGALVTNLERITTSTDGLPATTTRVVNAQLALWSATEGDDFLLRLCGEAKAVGWGLDVENKGANGGGATRGHGRG